MHLERIAWAGILARLLSLAAYLALPLSARDKTDLIVMKNGDRITCEIKTLQNAALQVSLDYVNGSISIDWFKVARVESDSLFIVQLEDGTTYSARVVSPEGPAPIELEIQTEGQAPLVVDKTRIVRMTQTSEGVLQRFSGKITLGSTHSKGNNATQYNLGSELNYTDMRWGGTLDYTSNLSSSTGATSSTWNQFDLTTYRLLPWKDFFYAGTGGLLQSSVQGIQRQTELGGGIGRFFKNTNRVRFSVMGGLGWQRTNYVPGAQTQRLQNVPVGLILSNLQVFSFKRTTLSVSGSLAPALAQQDRLFSKIDASYYLKVFGKLDWNFSFYGSWDTQPPARLQSSNYGTSTGLSWTFGNK
jgi:hypothetical protein